MLFSVLPEEMKRELATSAPLEHFDPGQLIQQRGDDPDGFWLIDKGSVAVGQFLAEGEFRGVALLGPGDSWGELALFANRPRVVDSVARSACDLRHIAAHNFESALKRDPAAMRTLLSALSEQLQETLEVVAAIRRGSASARTAGLLTTLAGSGLRSATIGISQQELGEFLGLTRASINVALRDFEERGLVRRGYRAVEVLDYEALVIESLR